MRDAGDMEEMRNRSRRIRVLGTRIPRTAIAKIPTTAIPAIMDTEAIIGADAERKRNSLLFRNPASFISEKQSFCSIHPKNKKFLPI